MGHKSSQMIFPGVTRQHFERKSATRFFWFSSFPSSTPQTMPSDHLPFQESNPGICQQGPCKELWFTAPHQRNPCPKTLILWLCYLSSYGEVVLMGSILITRVLKSRGLSPAGQRDMTILRRVQKILIVSAQMKEGLQETGKVGNHFLALTLKDTLVLAQRDHIELLTYRPTG